MTDSTEFSPYDPDAVPPEIVRYLTAQADPRRRAGALDTFALDARVVDEGIEYAGLDAIRRWLTTAASQYTYTTTLLGHLDAGDGRWIVHGRIEGDFPGGVADLRYRFVVGDGLIQELVIAP